MDEKHRATLRTSRMAICLIDFSPLELVDDLQRKNTLTATDRNIIIREEKDNRKKEKLLDILPKRGPRAYQSLIDACRELKLTEILAVLGEGDSVPNNEYANTDDNLKVSLDVTDQPKQMEKAGDETDSGISGPLDTIDTPLTATEDVDGRILPGKKKKKTSDTLEPTILPKVYPEVAVDPADCYDVSTEPRGYFLLINNKDFLPSSGMENYPRNGTDVDADAMKALFEELGFIVHSHRNLSVYEMRREFKKAATQDYSNLSMCVCCVLSHGQEGELFGIDGKIDIRELTSFFRGKNLAGKPKLFFFQACQGSDYMDSVEPDGGHYEVDGPPDGNDISLPTEADFLYSYSTVPGYYSWRNSARGSWFIQATVKVFRQYAHKMDLVRMLTRVNNIVSTKKSQTGQRASHHKRQISSIITQLRKELYFVPPNGPLKSYAGDF